MIHRPQPLSLPAALCALAICAAPAVAQGFGQEAVETRALRNPSAAGAAQASHDGHSHGHGHGDDHGIETESLFGFVLGSDVEHAGARSVALETVIRTGKGVPYTAIGKKLEFAFGVTNQLSVSLGLLAAYNDITDFPEAGDRTRGLIFNGIGGEVRYRLLDRKTSPIGLTVHLEPVIALSDELSGKSATKYGAENKLIFDRELVEGKLFGAFNVLHEIEYVREKGADEWEKGSRWGLGGALTYQVMPGVFLGAEARYVRAYEGLGFDVFTGDAWYVGPNLHLRKDRAWLSLGWNAQVAGGEPGSRETLNLSAFERHQVRLKVGYEF